jgi:hypothetical protein
MEGEGMYEYDHTIALQWDESSHCPAMAAMGPAPRRYHVVGISHCTLANMQCSDHAEEKLLRETSTINSRLCL